MGIINVSLPNDGETADVSDYNTPINTIVTEVNGNLDNDNIKSNAAISGAKLADASVTNAKLATGAGEPGGAWTSWTPTWTGYTIGNGTVNAKYTQIGKTVFFRIFWDLGTTSSFGASASFTVPVTQTTDYPTLAITPIGRVIFSDAGATFAYGTLFIGSTGDITIRPETASTAYVSLSNTASNIPFTPDSSDSVFLQGFYEAA